MRDQTKRPATEKQKRALKERIDKGVELCVATLARAGMPLTTYGIADEMNLPEGAARNIIAHCVARGRVKKYDEIYIREGRHLRRFNLYTVA